VLLSRGGAGWSRSGALSPLVEAIATKGLGENGLKDEGGKKRIEE
jgi:hypothetical protein